MSNEGAEATLQLVRHSTLGISHSSLTPCPLPTISARFASGSPLLLRDRGRRADEITLVGVTKYVGTARRRELVAAGCTISAKAAARALAKKRRGHSAAVPAPIRWHLIGHLQRNKIRRMLPLVSLIHSVDSERLLAAIDESGKAPHSTKPTSSSYSVLLEVNTSGESAKHGLSPDAVEPCWPRPSDSRASNSWSDDDGRAGRRADVAAELCNVRDLRQLARVADTFGLHELSMGMSGDFEVAIARRGDDRPRRLGFVGKYLTAILTNDNNSTCNFHVIQPAPSASARSPSAAAIRSPCRA